MSRNQSPVKPVKWEFASSRREVQVSLLNWLPQPYRCSYTCTPVGGASCTGLQITNNSDTIRRPWWGGRPRVWEWYLSSWSLQLATKWTATRMNLIREANSSPAALWHHTAETDPVLGLATGFLCVREPLWIDFLTNLSTWSGNIQQLHGTFNLHGCNEKMWQNVLNRRIKCALCANGEPLLVTLLGAKHLRWTCGT